MRHLTHSHARCHITALSPARIAASSSHREMPPSPTKTLSPAELAKLEHAFATDPASDAYRALAEAYLGLGRFMEAMVVCKKGVKGHPTSPEPRLLLARVYAEQGKDRKALEEATAALQVAPESKSVLRLVGHLQLKTGETDAGKASLLKAHAADPADADTLALMQQHGVAVPAPAPAPAPVVAPAPVPPPPPPAALAASVQQSPGPRAGGPPVLYVQGGPSAAPAAPAGRAPVSLHDAPTVLVPVAPAPRRAQPQAAAQRPPAARRPPLVVDVDLDDDDFTSTRTRRERSGGGFAKAVFFALLIVVPLGIGGYTWWGQQARMRKVAIAKLLSSAGEELKHDSFDAYQKVCKDAEEALEVDADSTLAHGYLAYAYAIRWAEHGEGDEARSRAERHLAAGKAGSGELSSHLLAADALYKIASGSPDEALAGLSARVEQLEKEKRQSSLLYLTLGIIQMNAGELDKARTSLETAQALAPADPRIYSALGTLFRRRGLDAPSEQNFDYALRYERNHPESLLGKALLMLQQESPDYAGAADLLKRLLEASPAPSPRQLATANMARALLIGRVVEDLPSLSGEAQRRVLEATGISPDRAKAQAELEKAELTGFSLDRQNPELHLIKGRRLLLARQVDAAAEEMRKAVKLDPTRAQFHMELARALMQKQGGEVEAAEALRTALRSMGDSPKLLMLLGDAYRRQGKSNEAVVQYAKALGDPKDPRARYSEARVALGSVLRERRDLARAQEELEKATQELLAQPSRLAAALTELARVHVDRNDPARADDAFQRALNTDADYAPAYFHYARFMLEARGQGLRARTLAQEYLKRAPRGEYAAEAQRLAE